MRTLTIYALIATLCVAPAIAQPQEGTQTFAVQPADERNAKPRPAEINLQIEQDLGELIDALDQPNANFTALPYIYGARVGYFGSNEWAPHFKAYHSGEIKLKDVKVLKHLGNDATATVSYAFVTTPNDEASKAQMENQQETLEFKLVRVPLNTKRQVWQIVPPEVKPPIIGAKNSDVLWANVSYHLAQKELYRPDGALAERSMNNLKQLGLGVAQFLQDYDEIYAFEPRYLSEAISPYVASRMIFQVPDTNEIYTFNTNLSGLNIHQVRSSEKTVLFYEGQNEKPTFRYDGRAAIGFADGHAALIAPDEAKNLIWKP